MIKVARVLFALAIVTVILFSCSKLPDEVYMERAQAHEESAEWDKAIASYDKLARLYPRSPLRAEAIYKSGLAYAHGKEDYKSAIEKLEAARSEYSADPIASQCQFMIGFIYANMAKDTSNARNAYKLFIEKYPNHELRPSVEWELKYLGKDINEIEELRNLGDGLSGSAGQN